MLQEIKDDEAQNESATPFMRPHPEQTREPAVLHRVKQVQVVVEVALQRLLLLLVADAAKQNCPACWSGRQGETRARRRFVAGGVQPGPGPFLWRRRKMSRHDKPPVAPNSPGGTVSLLPWPSLPSRFRRNMSEWMVPFSTSFFTLWNESRSHRRLDFTAQRREEEKKHARTTLEYPP